MATIGIVHPGAMGSSLGAALVHNGHEVVWAGDGRSDATRARADDDGLRDVGSLDGLTEAGTLIGTPEFSAICSATAAGVSINIFVMMHSWTGNGNR